MSAIVVEWAPFTLIEGVTEAELLAASEILQSEFLSRQEGFVRRELLRGQDGRWCDLVHWSDVEAASRAMQEASRSEVCVRYFHLMVIENPDDLAATVSHFTVQASYAA